MTKLAVIQVKIEVDIRNHDHVLAILGNHGYADYFDYDTEILLITKRIQLNDEETPFFQALIVELLNTGTKFELINHY